MLCMFLLAGNDDEYQNSQRKNNPSQLSNTLQVLIASSDDCNTKNFDNIEVKKCENILNVKQYMVNIRTVIEQSGNCDKLATEDDMLKPKYAQNGSTSSHIYPTSSLVTIFKKTHQQILTE